MLTGLGDVPMYAVQHRGCGHAVGVGPDRARMERLKSRLASGGLHGFRVRVLAGGEVKVARERIKAGGDDCPVCRIPETDKEEAQ